MQIQCEQHVGLQTPGICVRSRQSFWEMSLHQIHLTRLMLSYGYKLASPQRSAQKTKSSSLWLEDDKADRLGQEPSNGLAGTFGQVQTRDRRA